MKSKYIQYGCGWYQPYVPKSWRNFDASPTLLFERIPLIGKLYVKNQTRFPDNVEYGDIVEGLPVDSNSCKAVYCSHVLEHLALDELRKALFNTFKILMPGGTFRFVMPDLEYYISLYLEDDSNISSINFMRNTLLGLEHRDRGIKNFFMDWLSNSKHLWMWDYDSILHELDKVGFVNVRRAMFSDFSEPMFSDVEFQERWENCLGVECNKPPTSN